MSDDLPPSMYGDGDNLDDIYEYHKENWDSFAESLDYGGGHELFEDVTEALQDRNYGAGEGWQIDDWLDGITNITDFYQDNQGNWHIQFSFEFDTEDGHYEGTRGW